VIAYNAFSGCTGITNVVVPTSVMYINSRAFYNCTKLTNITLPFVGFSRNANKTSDAVFGYIFGSDTSSGTNKTQ
jgi:hypothetical protein